MEHSNQQRLLGAVRACLVPLARILIRAGISFRQFSEMAKAAFVDQTLAERDSHRKTTNISRIAVRTGLSRKEIARILRRPTDKGIVLEQAQAGTFHFHQAARVLQLWHSDPRFVGEDGRPRDLPVDGTTDSFASLVRSAGGDAPPGAVRVELMASGALSEMGDGHLRVLKRDYVPEDIGAGVDRRLDPGRLPCDCRSRTQCGEARAAYVHAARGVLRSNSSGCCAALSASCAKTFKRLRPVSRRLAQFERGPVGRACTAR